MNDYRHWITRDGSHIHVRDRDTGERVAVILDLGGSCAIDTIQALTPQRALDVGVELMLWAHHRGAS